jgi:uncharacterized membrane-anchored protein
MLQANVMKEVLSLLILDIAALLSVNSSLWEDEAFLRWLIELLLLIVVGSLRLHFFAAFRCEHIV